MAKRMMAMVLAIMLLLGCMPGQAAVLTKAEQYEAALEELKSYLNDDSAASADELFEQFSALGSYEYSAELAIYTRVLKDIQNGEFSRLPQLFSYLRMNAPFCAWLQEDGELGNVDQLEWYAKGLEAEREGNWPEAARCFEQSIPFKDSFHRSITLQESWLEERYQQAMTYYRQDTYAGYQQAYEIFQELAAYGGYKDSNNYLAMADILRATPAPTVAPTPKPTPKPTATPKPKLAIQKNKISAGYNHTVGLKADGKVLAVGNNEYRKLNVSDWRNVVAVSAGYNHTVGLKADGTVVAVGSNDNGQCNVSGWRDIVAISAGHDHTVGLKADGTVVAVGAEGSNRCNVSDWRDIMAISAGHYHTVGLKADGTVVAVGDGVNDRCNVSDWRDIVAISAGYYHTVGLKADGTVLAVGINERGECDVSGWRNIVAISAGHFNTVGLKEDGTVIAVGSNSSGQCEVNNWRDIVAVSSGSSRTVGLKSDGTVLAIGYTGSGACYVSNWNLLK